MSIQQATWINYEEPTVPILLFPKKNRLLTPADYQRVFKQGRKIQGVAFSFFYCPNQLLYARLGLAVAKRNVANASKRNRIRRVIREHFRHSQILLPGWDIIVVGQRELEKWSSEVLSKEVRLQWEKCLSYLKKLS